MINTLAKKRRKKEVRREMRKRTKTEHIHNVRSEASPTAVGDA